MKKLETTYRQDGFDHDIVCRNGNIAIINKSKDGKARGFEVIKIQSHNGFVIAGKTIPASEHPPRSEDWGHEGWTYTTLADAELKFKALILNE